MKFRTNLIKKFAQYYLTLSNKIGNNLEKFLLKFNGVSYHTYTTGHFFLYWSVYWLIIRLSVRPWILNFAYTNELNFQLHPYLFTLVTTPCFIVLAFLPTLLTSTSLSLCLYIHKVHLTLLYENVNWRSFVTTLVSIESWIMHSKKRRLVSALSIFLLFISNFTGNDNIYLFMWLSFLYTFLYYSRVVYPIFPNYPKSKKFLLEMDGDFFSDSLDIHYEVKRPSYGIKPRNKKKPTTRFFHTTAQVLFPGGDMFEKTGGKTWFNHHTLRAAAQESVLRQKVLENITKNTLPDHVQGSLGGKPFTFPNQEAANMTKTVTQVVSEHSVLSPGSRQIVTRALGATRAPYILAGGAMLCGGYFCVNTIASGVNLAQEVGTSIGNWDEILKSKGIDITISIGKTKSEGG
jgi:hypothetical protein